VAITNALQLEAARATPVLSRFNYNAMPSLKSLNLFSAVLFCCWYITLRRDIDLCSDKFAVFRLWDMMNLYQNWTQRVIAI